MNPVRIMVTLEEIQCIDMQEWKQDELYCVVQLYNVEGEKIKHYRLPHEGYWPIKQGETKQVEEVLFADDELKLPVSLRLIFKEEDIPDISRPIVEAIRQHASEILPDLVDDFLGEIYLTWNNNGSMRWVSGLNVVEKEATDDFVHTFDILIAGDFQYQIKIRSTTLPVS